MLFILKYESATYMGAGEYAVVDAETKEQACYLAGEYMEEFFCEQELEQYTEEYGPPEGSESWTTLVSCEYLTPQHEIWPYVTNPGQACHYVFIGVAQEDIC